VSLLLAQGHSNARNYTLACLFSESRIVRERQAAQTTLEAILMQTVIASCINGQEATKELNKLLAKVNDVG